MKHAATIRPHVRALGHISPAWNNKVAHSDLMRANRGAREPEVVVWFSAKGVRHASAEVETGSGQGLPTKKCSS